MNPSPIAPISKKRAKFWEALDASYAALEADPEAWRDWQAEITAWDVTLIDGLEDLEHEDWSKNPKQDSSINEE